MFKKMIEKENPFIKDFSEFASFEGKGADSNYKVCVDFGFQYLGEFFERYERESINPMGIVKGIACSDVDVSKHQIYEGQLDKFKKEVDKLIEDESSFLDKLCYCIFLQKFGYKKDSKTILDSIIESLKIDSDFLALTLAINGKNLCVEEEDKDIIRELLNKEDIGVDALCYIKKCSTKTNYLEEHTELPALKFICETYDLKKRYIEDSNKLKFFKELKKIGTRKLEYDAVKDFINLSKQDFYFISLKISYEINSAITLYRTNEYLSNCIQDSIDVNSKSYIYFPKMQIKLGKDCFASKIIQLGRVDFNNVNSEYFDEFKEVYLLNGKTIKYKSFKNIASDQKFMKYFSDLDNEENGIFKNNFALAVIKNNEDKDINDFYFSNIIDPLNIKLFDKLALIERGYLDINSFMEEVVSEDTESRKKLNFAEKGGIYNYNIRYKDIYSEDLYIYNLKDTAFSLLKYFLENDIVFNFDFGANWINIFVKDVYKVVLNNKEYFFNSENAKENVSLVLDFIFMYDTRAYLKTLIEFYKDDFLNKYLDISEDEIKAICEECLNGDMEDNGLLNEIKSIYFKDKERELFDCKQNFDKFLNSNWIYAYADYDYYLNKMREKLDKCDSEDRNEFREYVIEQMSKTNETYIKYMSSKILSRLIEKELIEKEDAMQIVEKLIDSLVLERVY